MTKKELRETVLKALYDNQNELPTDDFAKFCKEKNINFKNDAERYRILEYLNLHKYIKIVLYANENAMIKSITAKGIDAVINLIEEEKK